MNMDSAWGGVDPMHAALRARARGQQAQQRPFASSIAGVHSVRPRTNNPHGKMTARRVASSASRDLVALYAQMSGERVAHARRTHVHP
jgi:hypothetical protein